MRVNVRKTRRRVTHGGSGHGRSCGDEGLIECDKLKVVESPCRKGIIKRVHHIPRAVAHAHNDDGQGEGRGCDDRVNRLGGARRCHTRQKPGGSAARVKQYQIQCFINYEIEKVIYIDRGIISDLLSNCVWVSRSGA